MKKLILTATVLALAGIQQPAFAHGDEEHEGHHNEAPSAEMKVDSEAVTAPEALAEIQAGMKIISTLTNSGKLDAIHEEIEKIEIAAQILKEKSTAEGDQKTRLDSSLKQFSTQLGKLHVASDSKDTEKTKAELKKVEGALKLLESTVE